MEYLIYRGKISLLWLNLVFYPFGSYIGLAHPPAVFHAHCPQFERSCVALNLFGVDILYVNEYACLLNPSESRICGCPKYPHRW